MTLLIGGSGVLIVCGPRREWLPCEAAAAPAVLAGWRAENPECERWGDLTAVFGEVIVSEFQPPSPAE